MTQRTLLIAIAGRMGVGKSTLATGLIHDVVSWPDALGDTACYRLAFADALRREVGEKFLVPDELLGKFADKDTPVDNLFAQGRTVRQLLQQHGAARRAEDPDYWVKQTDRAYLKNLQSPHGGYPGLPRLYVIDDLRYPNERDWVRRNGGIVVWLGSQAKADVDAHESEQYVVPDPDMLFTYKQVRENYAREVLGKYVERHFYSD